MPPAAETDRPAYPLRTADPCKARASALFWSYTSGKDAVIVLAESELLILIGPHREFLRGRTVLARVTPLGKTTAR